MTDDQARPGATSPDTEFTLTIDEAVERYARAGLPRTPRSVQRYCAKGHLDCRRVETSFGEKFLITAASIDKHIAYIEEVRPVAARRDEPRQAATTNEAELFTESDRQGAPTSRDLSRQAAAEDNEQFEQRDVLTERNIEIIGADPITLHGFTQVPNFLLTMKDVSVGAKLTYAMLLKYAWGNKFCFPGQVQLADDMGATDRSVRTYQKELESAGLLEIKQRGLGRTNLYRLHLIVKGPTSKYARRS
jgi:hypothetical protein